MPGQLKILVELQKIDSYLKEVGKDQEELPQRLAEMDRELARAATSLKKLQEKLQEVQKTRRDREGEVDAEEEQIKKLAAKSTLVKTNKEYQALLKEIDQAKKTNWAREDEILNLLTKIEELEEEIHEQEELLKRKEQEIERRKAEFKTRLEKLEAGAAQKQERRQTILSQVEPALMRRYQFIANKLGVAVVPVRGTACQGCHMQLSPQTIVDLKSDQELVTCPSCHRILHLEEEPV